MPRTKKTQNNRPKTLADFGEILTPKEVSELLVISRNSVYNLMQSGKLPFFRIGSHFKVPKRQLAITFGLMRDDK